MFSVKLHSRVRLNFSHLNKHKVRHGFKDGNNCMCDYGSATGTTLHFLLKCCSLKQRLQLFNSICKLDTKMRNLSHGKLFHLLLCGWKLYSFEIKRQIIKLSTKFINLSKRFERPLLWLVFPLPAYHLHRNLITFFSIF